MPKKIIFFLIAIAIIIVGGIIYLGNFYFGENIYSGDTGGWKTYADSELGYQIKYPQEWCFKDDFEWCTEGTECLRTLRIKSNQEEIGLEDLRKIKEGVFQILVFKEDPQFSVYSDKIKAAGLTEKREAEALSFVKEKIIGGVKTEAWEIHDIQNAVGFEFIHNGKLYQLAYISATAEELEKNKSVFQGILSTFKFIK
ncbi:MAG: hypothetical protein PHP03_01480 [Candidatus Pacebacteria bacterium]|nr:hypothetical protein [Candidatus Paceibacterota bacterium]